MSFDGFVLDNCLWGREEFDKLLYSISCWVMDVVLANLEKKICNEFNLIQYLKLGMQNTTCVIFPILLPV